MTRFFILVKRKGSKTWKGAIPTRKGVTRKQLIKRARNLLKKGMTYRIITERQLRMMFKKFLRSGRKRSRRKR